jgi:hypothetical protein
MTHINKKLPVDIQSFETMRTENYLYVDKTQHIHRMVTEGKFYFLSRPRRFGKSLLVSTLDCLFQGRKDLFEGLWIAEESDWDWNVHPVIPLDFNGIPGNTPEELKQGIAFRLTNIAHQYGIRLEAPFVELQFDELILKLYDITGMQVVVLIDEYDKRIIEHLGKGEQHLELAKANREALKSFFGILKGQSVASKLRLVFLTGVSRFSKVSLFSDLNNLQDISMSERYVEMLGYTQKELEFCFEEHIDRFAQKFGWSRSQVIDILARKYNGYRFSHSPLLVYNPFSILNAFNNQELGDYWFESATPTFLVDYLRYKQYNLPKIEGLEVSRTIFSNFEIEHLRPEALLFQTGYLTIKDVRNGIYTLDYPNQEVKSAFSEALLFSLTAESSPEISSLVLQLPGYLKEENFEAFFETMSAIFASIPYDIEAKRDEAYFHTIFYLMMSASGLIDVQSSVLTSKGRIDLVIIFPEKIYMIEFKCNQSAETALRQIRDKNYAEKYRRSGKKIILMGINFNQQERKPEEWKIQPDKD